MAIITQNVFMNNATKIELNIPDEVNDTLNNLFITLKLLNGRFEETFDRNSTSLIYKIFFKNCIFILSLDFKTFITKRQNRYELYEVALYDFEEWHEYNCEDNFDKLENIINIILINNNEDEGL